GEDPTAVKARTPVLDANFTGNESANIIASPGIGSSSSRSYFNLPFVNTPGARFSFAAQPNTSYLWVFTLQFDGATIRRDGTRCSITEQSSSDGVFTYRSGGCVDNCLKPAPSNTTPAARTFSIGDEVTVGHFRARLTRVSGTGASLSGEATVNIPVFRGGMQVEFSNVQVNELGEMFGGEMRGKMAPEVPVSGTVANALTGGLGLTGPQVRSIHELASDGRRLVSGLIEGSSMTLPIGFDRVIEGQRVVVGVMGMVFKPTDARMNVVLSFPMPAFGPGERIGFGARNICFYPNGIGRDVDIGLVDDLGYTASDTSWSFHFLAPREAAAGVRADSGTFARFGCNGFEFIRLKAEVAFPRTWMKKVDPGSGAVVEGEHVKAQFTTLIRASGDFIAEATMDRFTPAGAPDFVMQVDTVTFDFSEADNPRSLVFPARYRGTTGNAWKGFFINRVYCKFPDQLRTFDTDRPLNAELRTFLIDRSGLTFFARVNNIVRYPRGNIGGWGASIDTVGLDIVSSSLESGRLV
ncbi:MAG: hypothetical protein JNL32_16115, partial [Candidatus Kapabacteria bacterium]|nr:hypothetical protein [Candidatus Kapabacteria bacterium]